MSPYAIYQWASAFSLAVCSLWNFVRFHREEFALSIACSAACAYCALHAVTLAMGSP